mgnify:CR=1 FL=1
MSRNRDNSDIPETCPLINDVWVFIDRNTHDETKESDKQKALDLLEKIREHNEKLRKWGNIHFNRAECAEKELEDANKEIDFLKDQIKELESEDRS